jgi:uncharacterized membrane protein (DUF485 family)
VKKYVKIYLMFMAIIAFAIGWLGLSILFLTTMTTKGFFISISGFVLSWFINEDILKHEKTEEEHEH